MEKKKAAAVLFAVGICTFMAALDSSVINLVMPLIMEDFGVTLSMAEWVVTAYLLVVSSLLLTYGRLSDIYGQKRIYLTGLIIFILGSVLCGLSVRIEMLIACRVVQALGAGMLFATGPAIITNAVAPERRGRALSAVAVAVALGLSSGPVIGGFLATYVGWPSIFFINAPIGLVAVVLVVLKVPNFKPKAEKVPFDILGSVLVFLALLLILLPLNISGDYEISPALFVGLIGLGVLLIAGFIVRERRYQYPMLDLNLFKNRVFAASNAAALFIYMAQFILVILIPIYLQTLRGFTTSAAGLLYMPLPLAAMCIAPVSGAMSDRVDSRFISSGGALLMAGGLLMISFVNTVTPIGYIIVSMAVVGLGFGIFQTPNNSAIMGSVPAQRRGIASGTLATMRNIGMALGVAVSAALFEFFSQSANQAFVTDGLSGQALENAAFVNAIHNTYLAAAAVALLSMTASLIKGRVRPKRDNEQPIKDA